MPSGLGHEIHVPRCGCHSGGNANPCRAGVPESRRWRGIALQITVSRALRHHVIPLTAHRQHVAVGVFEDERFVVIEHVARRKVTGERLDEERRGEA